MEEFTYAVRRITEPLLHRLRPYCQFWSDDVTLHLPGWPQLSWNSAEWHNAEIEADRKIQAVDRVRIPWPCVVWELLGDGNRPAWFSLFVLVLRRLAQWPLLPGRRILFTRSHLYKTSSCEKFYYHSRSVLLSVRRPRYNFDPLSQLSWYEFDHVTAKHPIPIRPDKTEMIGRSVLTFSGGCGVIVSEDVCANAPGPCYLVRLESGKYPPVITGMSCFWTS